MHSWPKPFRLILISALALGLPARAQLNRDSQVPLSPPPDTVVHLTAEAQGLTLVPPLDVPPFGTFWLMEPGMGGCLPAPMPCPPLDPNLPIYALASGQFLVDCTVNQILSPLPNGSFTATATAASILEA